jgi:hypothetical protein
MASVSPAPSALSQGLALFLSVALMGHQNGGSVSASILLVLPDWRRLLRYRHATGARHRTVSQYHSTSSRQYFGRTVWLGQRCGIISSFARMCFPEQYMASPGLSRQLLEKNAIVRDSRYAVGAGILRASLPGTRG